MKLQNKTILITASTRGIGLATVKQCLKEGATVVMAARNLARAEEIAAPLRQEGGAVHCVYCDAANAETYPSMVEETLRVAGSIHGLVNNFGTSDRTRDLDFARTEVEDFLSTVTVNLQSVFLASQAALPALRESRGSIVNISSVGGIVPDITQVGYGTAKAAINHLTKLIAVQEAKFGVRCNAVLPGMTATDAVIAHLTEEFRHLFLRHIPLGRMGLPEEIAAAVCFFLSEEAAYATGQILTLSGGFGLATPIYGDVINPQ